MFSSPLYATHAIRSINKINPMKVPSDTVCMPPHEGRLIVHSASKNLGAKQPMIAANAPPPTHDCTEHHPIAVNALSNEGRCAPFIPNVILAKRGNGIPYLVPTVEFN